jgi:lysophospholipase L1-like esterase
LAAPRPKASNCCWIFEDEDCDFPDGGNGRGRLEIATMTDGSTMNLAIKLALGPVLLGQGLYVRRRTPLLPEPTGPRSGISGEGRLLRLLVLGDSAAAGVGVKSQNEALLGQLVQRLAACHEVHWTLIARTGATSRSTHDHLAKIAPVIADVVVISLGVNDVTSGVPLDDFVACQSALLALLKGRFEAGQIIVSGLPPMHRFPALRQPLRWYLGTQAKAFDRALQQLVFEAQGCTYLAQPADGDFSMMASDGFHPAAAVYARWAALAAAALTFPT